MDKKYVTLFKELTQTTAVTAEQVIEYDRNNGDEHGAEIATKMRDDYQALTDKIKEAGDSYQMSKEDAARSLVAAMIMVNQLSNKVNTIQSAIKGYQTDVIPKLKDIVDNAKTDDDASKMADEKFIIENKE